MLKWMITCEQATFLKSKSMDSPLSLKEKWQLKVHLMSCKFCRLFDKQVSQLEAKIKINTTKMQLDSSLKLSDYKKDNIKKELKREIDSNIL